jgi:(1->4)-alpha-D-glucan 1-alpha-D-glucosylmutase
VLANGELKVHWNEKEEIASAEGHPIGAFQIHYYGAHFPIDPSTLPSFILEPALQSLSDAATTELQHIISQLRQLPPRDTIGGLNILRKERRNMAHSTKASLSKLLNENKEVRNAVFAVVDRINDKKQLSSLTQLVEAQAYRLAYWKLASDELNYRRFFDINELMAIKAERREVFEESLQLVAQWIKAGHVDALRLDHPDGLYDPAKFFAQLQDHIKHFLPSHFQPIDPRPTRPLYVLVEKILEPGESLVNDWPVSGTVGYEYLNLLNNVYVDTAQETAMRLVYRDFIRDTEAAKFTEDFHELLYNSKKLLLTTSFETELNSLALLLHEIAKADSSTIDFSTKQLKYALVELIACFPVYRTYITQDTPKPTTEEAARITEAVNGMRNHNFVDPLIVDFLERIVVCKNEEGLRTEVRNQCRHLIMKLQQLTGPVMAKGLEDTSFYRFFLLTSLNEVGGDPNTFGVNLDSFHAYNVVRNRDWPQAMSNSSTHDTKRSEDVRARINVLSEIPDSWNRELANWKKINEKHKKEVAGIGLVPEPNEEYLISFSYFPIPPFISFSLSLVLPFSRSPFLSFSLSLFSLSLVFSLSFSLSHFPPFHPFTFTLFPLSISLNHFIVAVFI